MKHLAPTIFRAFACAGGACPDSCCRAGWEIIPDEKTLKLYEKLPGAAGDRVRAGIVQPCRGAQCAPAGESEPLLRQDERRVCVLLDPDGLCHVQKQFGHEALCRVCREYPRFHREFGNLTEHGVSLSCPTAYALAVREPLQWETWEDEAPVVPNDLDPDAYLRLRRGRALALDLLAREDRTLWQRIALVRRLAAAIQKAPEKLVRHDYAPRLRRWEVLGSRDQGSGISVGSGFSVQGSAFSVRRDGTSFASLPSAHVRRDGTLPSAMHLPVAAHTGAPRNRFRDRRDGTLPSAHARRDGTLPSARHTAGAVIGRPASGLDCLAERFAGLEILSPAWGEKLERFRTLLRDNAGARCAPLPGLWETDRPEVYARYLAYSLYKYWLDALDDGNLLGRVERSLSMTLLGLALDRAFPEEGPHLQRISREIEHCEENLAALLSY